MRRRLLSSTGLIALVAVLVLGVPLGAVGSRLLAQRTEQRLEREADAASVALEHIRRQGRPITQADVARVAGPGHRLEVVLPDGRRISAGPDVGNEPIRVRGSGALDVIAIAPHSEGVQDTGAVWLAVIVLSLAAVAAAIALALVQARRLAGPMERLARRAGHVGHDGAGPAPHSGIAEVDHVGEALDAADARIAELLRREREFSANVSHQLRSPLTALRMRLEELRALAEDDAVAREEADAALLQSDRLQGVIEHLEALARGEDGQARRVDLAEVVGEHVRRDWEPRFAAAGRELHLRAGGEPSARVEPETALQVLDVLLDNALHHGAGTTTVTVGDGRLQVADEGAGVDDEHAGRLFDRHFSTSGSGVGLAVAREMARRDGGDLRLVHARPATFEARLRGGSPRPAG